MKIGILTWYYGPNHGARAHTYALLNTLRDEGYDVELIRYHPWVSFRYVEPYWIKTKNIPLMIRKIIYRLCFRFSEKDYIYLSRHIRNIKKLDGMGYDLIVLGSDEIFNISHPITSRDYAYFGVGITKTPMITYAVSCGQSDVGIMWPQEVKEAVNRIQSLSVRDRNSQLIIENNISRTPTVVLDPTLLYDYSTLIDPDWKYQNYILIYSFGSIDRYKDKILEYSEKTGLKIISVGNLCTWADISIKFPSQRTWYSSFANASIVITNSFHGTIFAIKNNKPFVNILLADKETKISNLLSQFNMVFGDRLLNDTRSIEDCLKNEIDYKMVNDLITKEREKSIVWLKEKIDVVKVEKRLN